MSPDSRSEKFEGVVEEALPSLFFRIKLNGSGESVLARLGGKLKINRIRVIPGDRVIIEMTPYDDKRGRIIRRL
jgi:translation initiation factor IF-1